VNDRWEWDILETIVLRKPGLWLAECFPQPQYLYCCFQEIFGIAVNLKITSYLDSMPTFLH
jgi:hypothetical protein